MWWQADDALAPCFQGKHLTHSQSVHECVTPPIATENTFTSALKPSNVHQQLHTLNWNHEPTSRQKISQIKLKTKLDQKKWKPGNQARGTDVAGCRCKLGLCAGKKPKTSTWIFCTLQCCVLAQPNNSLASQNVQADRASARTTAILRAEPQVSNKVLLGTRWEVAGFCV